MDILGPCKRCGKLMRRPHPSGVCKECRKKTSSRLPGTPDLPEPLRFE